MKMFFIVPTLYRREEELLRLVKSINGLIHIHNKEIIIVNQGENKFKSKYDFENVVEINISQKGTSNAKNIGIEHALNFASDDDIFCFPDDDCWYDKNLFKNFEVNLNKFDVLVGRAYDPVQNKDFGFTQHKSNRNVNINNAHKFLMISMFFKAKIFKNQNLRFDKNLGVGAKYGCGEETDLLLNILKQDYKVLYEYDLNVFHLNYNMELSQLLSYSYGQGALLKKMIYKYKAFYSVLNILLRPIVASLIYVLKLDFKTSRKYLLRIKELKKGYYDYEI